MDISKIKNRIKNLHPFYMILAITAILAILDFFNIISLKNILFVIMDNILFSVLIVLGLYVLKGATLLVPNIIVYLAGGALFASPLLGLAINSLGMFITMSLSYYLGTRFNDEKIKKFNKQYKFVNDFANFQLNNVVFFCYVMRTITFIPCDVVSLYCGIMRMPYKKYISGSMLGVMPGLIAITIIGANITNPTSPQFIISASIQLVITFISVVIYAVLKKRPKKKA